jgi:hypothetical protein
MYIFKCELLKNTCCLSFCNCVSCDSEDVTCYGNNMYSIPAFMTPWKSFHLLQSVYYTPDNYRVIWRLSWVVPASTTNEPLFPLLKNQMWRIAGIDVSFGGLCQSNKYKYNTPMVITYWTGFVCVCVCLFVCVRARIYTCIYSVTEKRSKSLNNTFQEKKQL